MQEIELDNDKVFAAYVLVLFGGVASIVTASVMTGIASLPTPLSFLEHIALSFGFRAAYKSLGGMSWDDWSIIGHGAASAVPATGTEVDAHASTA